jgi:nicotinate-nucleotide pyrophosphorylase (carboxylating)
MEIDKLIEQALQEDIGAGDHTSLATIPESAMRKVHLLIKEEGILAGIGIAGKVFHQVDPDIRMEVILNDGAKVEKGDIAFIAAGKARSLLSAERLVLNFMQRMSGIATFTRLLTERIGDLPVKVLDTRKTTPLLRAIEKQAVRIGGGMNHRTGLYDMIMIKDNHVDFAGSIEIAIQSVHRYLNDHRLDLNIEVEVRNFDELKQVLNVGGVDRIMLDNFSAEDLKKAVVLIGKCFETEASGGINMDNIRQYAETGVDYISVGALTHHIRSLDMSLKAIRT